VKKNLKKVIRWLKEHKPVNDDTHPTNFSKAMEIIHKEKEQV
jgi:hypothetical protein